MHAMKCCTHTHRRTGSFVIWFFSSLSFNEESYQKKIYSKQDDNNEKKKQNKFTGIHSEREKMLKRRTKSKQVLFTKSVWKRNAPIPFPLFSCKFGVLHFRMQIFLLRITFHHNFFFCFLVLLFMNLTMCGSMEFHKWKKCWSAVA